MIFCIVHDYATSYATLLLHNERGKSHFNNELIGYIDDDPIFQPLNRIDYTGYQVKQDFLEYQNLYYYVIIFLIIAVVIAAISIRYGRKLSSGGGGSTWIPPSGGGGFGGGGGSGGGGGGGSGGGGAGR